MKDDMVPKVFEFSYGAVLRPIQYSLKINDGKIIPGDEFLFFQILMKILFHLNGMESFLGID